MTKSEFIKLLKPKDKSSKSMFTKLIKETSCKNDDKSCKYIEDNRDKLSRLNHQDIPNYIIVIQSFFIY